MGLGKHREQILAALRGACRASLRDEEAAWRAIEKAVALAIVPNRDGADRKARLDEYIYQLSLIYAHQTGAMPGFTNSESETHFERFAFAIPVPAELKITRNLIKAAIRRLDAKHNLRFGNDLKAMRGEDAAE
jgi:hypothetical protein